MREIKVPDFHDGKLVGISLVPDGWLELSLLHVDQSLWSLRVPRVVRVRATEFLEGNIVFDVRAYSADECTADMVSRLLGTDNETMVMDVLRSIHTDGLSILVLDSSYGCDVIATAACAVSDIVSVRSAS